MAWLSLQNRLTVELIHNIHECAIVLSVEEELRSNVQSERARFGADEIVHRQLDPHITLLFGGLQPPEVLRELAQLARTFEGEEVDFSIEGVGSFFNQNGLISNIHYRVHSNALHCLHGEVLNRFLAMGLTLQTPYVGTHYVPHVSMFNGVALPKSLATKLSPPPSDQRYQAGGCHLIGELK